MAEITNNKNNQSLNNHEYPVNTDLENNLAKSSGENNAVLAAGRKEKYLITTVIAFVAVILLVVFVREQTRFSARMAELKKATAAFESHNASQIISEMMVKCPAGEFIMGSPFGEIGRREDEVQHRVIFSKDFYISKYPITQMIYRTIMGDNPSRYKDDSCPVDSVNWFKAKEFCKKLNDLTADTRPDEYEFDLPTEAQWEYACRAGTSSSLNSGKEITVKNGSCYNLEEVAWYENNSGGKPHPVGLKLPNAWGIYDMHGNVWEWCRDYYGPYQTENAVDPEGPDTGYFRSDRGGSWINYYPCLLRSANRYCRNPKYEYNFLGFRIVLGPVKK